MTTPAPEKASPIPADGLAFGDAVTNIAASDDNPIKHGWFIRRGRRSGRVNAGSFVEYATADGRLHQTPPDNIAPRDAEPVFRAARASQEERHTPECRANMGWREERMVTVEHDEDGTPTVWCDPCIAPLVKALNDAGIRTVASCCGHSHRPGNIALADGRWLVIAQNDEEWRRIEALFPIDITGVDRSQEERIREDEREAIIDLIASWPEIGGYTGGLRQSILSTVLDRDAAIIQAIRGRSVMSAPIPTEVLELAMDAEVAIRNEDDHPTDIIARVIMRAAEDERDRLFAKLDGDGFANSGARAWFREQGAMLPADRARLRGGAS